MNTTTTIILLALLLVIGFVHYCDKTPKLMCLFAIMLMLFVHIIA